MVNYLATGDVIYHFSVAAPALRAQNALLTAQAGPIGGGSSSTARLSSLEETCSDPGRGTERAECALRELDALSRTDDTGSELSYAPALLNRQGDGVVLTRISSRTDTRTYAKAVQTFAPLVAASAEELDAIEKARTPVSSK